MIKILLVVDMQNDFIDGVLGTPEAKRIVPNVVKKIKEYVAAGDKIIVTQDMHFGKKYYKSLEHEMLPPHCVKGTKGANIHRDVWKALNGYEFDLFDKFTFGSSDAVDKLNNSRAKETVVEIVGVCTDICVISNALMARTKIPNLNIVVDASCCAGTTPANHKAALEVMKSCLIKVINE